MQRPKPTPEGPKSTIARSFLERLKTGGSATVVDNNLPPDEHGVIIRRIERRYMGESLSAIGLRLAPDAEILHCDPHGLAAAANLAPKFIIFSVNDVFVGNARDFDDVARENLSLVVKAQSTSAILELLARVMDMENAFEEAADEGSLASGNVESAVDFGELLASTPRYNFLAVTHPLFLRWNERLQQQREARRHLRQAIREAKEREAREALERVRMEVRAEEQRRRREEEELAERRRRESELAQSRLVDQNEGGSSATEKPSFLQHFSDESSFSTVGQPQGSGCDGVGSLMPSAATAPFAVNGALSGDPGVVVAAECAVTTGGDTDDDNAMPDAADLLRLISGNTVAAPVSPAAAENAPEEDDTSPEALLELLGIRPLAQNPSNPGDVATAQIANEGGASSEIRLVPSEAPSIGAAFPDPQPILSNGDIEEVVRFFISASEQYTLRNGAVVTLSLKQRIGRIPKPPPGRPPRERSIAPPNGGADSLATNPSGRRSPSKGPHESYPKNDGEESPDTSTGEKRLGAPQEICRDFLRGRCTRRHCTMLHSLGTAPPEQGKSRGEKARTKERDRSPHRSRRHREASKTHAANSRRERTGSDRKRRRSHSSCGKRDREAHRKRRSE